MNTARGTAPDQTDDGERMSATERAYRELRARIRDNILPAGSQHLESELALLLGMSRTPIREACIRLQDDGVLEIKPRHGVRILPVSASDMADIYVVMTELESAAARLLASKPASAEEIAALRAAVSDMEEALQDRDLDRWSNSDERFHLLLTQFADNSRLASFVSAMWDQAHRARLVTLNIRPLPKQSNEDHRQVVEAIARGDAAEAERIHRQHRQNAGKLLVDCLKKLGMKQV
jgi:DNA-binding GntR family transcriptional regulator